MTARRAITAALRTALMAMAAVGASAQDGSGFTFSGYGTLGYVSENADSLGFVRDLNQLGSHDSRGSWKTDSRLGLQLNYRASPRLEFVAQAVVHNQVDPSFARSVDWAFLNFRPVPELDLRVGRMGTDAFLMSDYRSVGYVYTGVRPPKEGYGWVTSDSLDGIDASYNIRSGDASWRVKAQFGDTRTLIPLSPVSTYDFQAKGIWNLTVARESGPWRIKAGYAEIKISSEAPLGELRDPLNELAAFGVPVISSEAATYVRQLQFKGTKLRYASIGAVYDDRQWQVQVDMSRIRADGVIVPQGTTGYVTLGRRFDAVMPYLMISRYRSSIAQATAGASWGVLGPEAALLQAAAVGVLNSVRIEQRTTSAGVRWDFHHQAALKLQWDHTAIGRRGYGLWTVADSNPQLGERVDVLSVTLDFVF